MKISDAQPAHQAIVFICFAIISYLLSVGVEAKKLRPAVDVLHGAVGLLLVLLLGYCVFRKRRQATVSRWLWLTTVGTFGWTGGCWIFVRIYQ
jgi:hypothetical protein